MPNQSAAPKPFFVVFDTCTHPDYYRDVHQVLALPKGTVIPYEYKRYHYNSDAAEALDALIDGPAALPVDALLMYGQKRTYQKGQGDPTDMLRWDDAVFIPTRSARIVAADRSLQAEGRSDALHFHLEMRGFIDPDSPLLEELVRALEASNSLPFGDRNTQYSWISLLPEEMHPKAATLISDDQRRWSTVVEKFITAPTQFHEDVFWRVIGINEAPRSGRTDSSQTELQLRDRKTNMRVHTNRWHRDYALKEGEKYDVCVWTYAPEGNVQHVPGDARIELTPLDDDEGLIKLAVSPLTVRPNAKACQRFSINTNAAINTRYAGVRLETQIPNRIAPAGSMCVLTFAIRKQIWRLIVGTLLMLAAFGIFAGTEAAELPPLITGLLVAASVLLLAFGGWLLKRQFTLEKPG
jgi:hypothetical protein